MSLPPRKATCHPDRRHQAKGLCKLCYEDSRAKRGLHRAAKRRYKERHPRLVKDYYYRTIYGISLRRVETIYRRQDGRCAICYTQLDPPISTAKRNHRTSSCVDHNHETGRIRGILCRSCNRTLGIIEAFSRLPGYSRYYENA